MNINFKKETKTAKMPTKANEHAAGIDFYADESVTIRPGKSKAISTGISWNPDPWAGMIVALIIQSRSGLAFRCGIESSNAGVIDQDYRGVIKALLYNNSEETVEIYAGDKVCQGVLQIIPCYSDVQIVDKSERGTNGFGSTGK